jgi:16S rRNA (cytidine1402-2'-O)-methyltransferase
MGAEQQEGDEQRRGYSIRGQAFIAPKLDPGLYVVATPIGNLSDVTIRALDTLAGADILACEDTRVTKRLLDRYGIDARITAYHEHSGPAAHRRLLDALGAGKSVALVSDAGTPLISDPGAALVTDAIAAGHRVLPIPGASSLATALSAAGLPTDEMLFLGFLPSKAQARKTYLEVAAPIVATLVLFESPNRIASLLNDAATVLGGARQAAVCRELTKIHETFDRGTLGQLVERYAARDVKGEIVLIIAPPDEAAPPEEADVDAALREALTSLGVKEAADRVAAATGLSRRTLYQRALKLKNEA